MNRWKWLAVGIVPIVLLIAAFALFNACLVDALAAHGQTGLLRMAVNLGANINGTCHGSYPLISAIRSHQEETVDYLLNAKAEVNVRDQELATPLMRAAEQKEAEIARRLVLAGADPNALDQDRRTPIRYAVRSGSYDIAAMLIEFEANINAGDNRGDTALMQATQANDVEMVRLLVKKGADPTQQDKAGRTAFDFFRRGSDPALIPLLRTVYFVPIVESPTKEINDLVEHYREKLGIQVRILPAIMPRSTDIDTARSQLIAEDVLESMGRAYPQYEKNSSAILIGITSLDMYASEERWQFCYGWRDPQMQKAVVSTARFDWQYPGAPPMEASVTQRLRKAVTKDIGVMYFWKPLSHDPKSVLYDGIMGIDDLDQTSEDF